MRFNRRGSNSGRHKSNVRRMLRAETLEARRVLAAAIDAVVWESLDANRLHEFEGDSYIAAVNYDLYKLDMAVLASGLVGAPHESEVDGELPLITLPRPDGNFERFQFVSSPVYAAGFAEKFPDINTYLGYGIDNPDASVRFDLTPHGFHAQVLAPQGGYVIDPFFHLSDNNVYASYFKADEYDLSIYETTLADSPYLLPDGQDDDGYTLAGFGGGEGGDGEPGDSGTGALNSGTELRTYRAAIAAAGEYTVFHGGTVELASAAIVTSLNRIVGVLEQELSVRFELVANNDQIIFTNPATDPYTGGGNLFPNLGENQAVLDSRIGVENYDIGHLFKTGGGGLAYLRSIGVAAIKAGAATAITPPVGEYFNLVTLHEIGHQLGANHTFSGDSGGCSGNINRPTAVEPGGGSTIMSYAGICGNDNLQQIMDANYHSVSVIEILDHIDGRIANVGQRSNPVNALPSVSGGDDYTIPAGTPFVLTATGFDADGDMLTYSWEQQDAGPQRDLMAGDDGISTLFRVFPPAPSPARYFPRLPDLVNNTLSRGETIPSTNRIMNFRVTARDNNPGAGAINTDDVRLTVVDTGTPFAITAPNTSVTWDGLSQQVVTWNVAGTTAAPISAEMVSIYFSADGGLTYPFVVAENLANSGTAGIFVPNVDTTTGRFMVKAADNVFFDITNQNLTVIGIPIVVVLDPGAASYIENSPAISVSPGAQVTVAGNLAGLTVDVSIASGREAGDELSILASSSISVTGNSLFFGGLNIGTISAVSGNYSVRLNSNATAVEIEAFVRSIAFRNSTDSPSNTPRSVEFAFGGVNSNSRVVEVVPVNDSPSIADSTLPTILEDSVAISGARISSILAGRVSDPDLGSSLGGIAVVGNPRQASQGVWFFSADGNTWRSFGSVDDAGQSLVLPPNAWLGFRPAENYFGNADPLTIRALDNTYVGLFSDPANGTFVYLDPTDKFPDGSVSANSASVGIEVQNVNDSPFANQLLIGIDVLQEQPIDRVFPLSLFGDIDSDNLVYTLQSANGGPLPAWISFNSATRMISGTPRNRDVGSYNLRLVATDQALASAQIPVSVSVANVNDAPINLRLTGNRVPENQSNATVGELFANDPDAGDFIVWSSSDSRFIIRDSFLILLTPLDYEVEQNVSLVLTAQDTGLPAQQSKLNVNLNVIDENEFFPELFGATFGIDDGTPAGTVIRTMTAPDADTLQTVRYRLKSGDVSDFSLNPVNGQLALNQAADVGVKSSYRVFVEAYDNGIPLKARTSQFIINVNPINAFPPTIPIGQTFTFGENARAGTVLGIVQAEDLDGEQLRYEILNRGFGQQGWVAIDPVSGVLRTTSAARFDFESSDLELIEVRVTETVQPFRSTEGIVFLQLTDANDPPTAISGFNVRSSQMGYQSTESVTVEDQDPAIGYTLETSDPRFEIRSGFLALRPNAFFTEAMAGTTTNVLLRVTDAGDPTSSALLSAVVNIIANPSPWQNSILPVDVTRNGNVTASDVLAVVNAINANNGQAFPLSRPRTLAEYEMPDIDVSGDNILTALDALLVVNYFNANASGSGEGPSLIAPQITPATPDVWLSAFDALEEETKRRRGG